MFTQVLTAFFTSLATRIANTFQGFHHVKFYFITLLIFLLSVAYMFKEPVTMYVKSKTYATIEFRECRDPKGLEKKLNDIVSTHPNIMRYGVYLYQPKDNAFYKKLILSNSDVAKNSPSLSNIYLADQPSINDALQHKDYYLVDKSDMDKPDLHYLSKLDGSAVIFFKLAMNDKLVGEINFRFKDRPTADELDLLITQVSPLIYVYVI